jgi:sec-independent protein translocase protein TatA
MIGLDNPIHLAFLLVLLLVVFGAKRLPEMGRSMGSGMRGFKEALSGHEAQEDLPPVPAPTAMPQVAAQLGTPVSATSGRTEEPTRTAA